jgi:hypothetical protein
MLVVLEFNAYGSILVLTILLFFRIDRLQFDDTCAVITNLSENVHLNQTTSIIVFYIKIIYL